MSGRGRLPPHAMKGAPPPSAHEPHFGGRGPLPPHLLDDPHFPDAPPFGPPRRGPSLPPHLLDDRISLQHQEIQTLLVDNQHLAATHVALKQELSAVQQELHHASRTIGAMQLEKDSRFREAYERSMKMESELRAADAMRAELAQIHGEIQKVGLERQELSGQVQALTRDLARNSTEMQQAPILKQQIEVMKQQIQHASCRIWWELCESWT